MTTTALRLLYILGAALDRHRVLAYCRILLAVETAVFFFFVAGTHGLIAPLTGPTSTDFVSFYAAGALADAGTPELAYDQAAHGAAEQRATAASSTGSSTTRRFSCCCAPPSPVCPI